jgi:hypothetical protein
MTSLCSAVTFAERVAFDDGFGNSVGCWIDRLTTRASITALAESGTVLAAWLTGTRAVTIRIRQSPESLAVGVDWKATDRDSGVAFNIRSIADPHKGDAEYGRWLDLVGEAGSPGSQPRCGAAHTQANALAGREDQSLPAGYRPFAANLTR